MNSEEFTRVYGESRNGANKFYRHPLVRKFLYSDGVHDLAETGCYWLLDIAATELPEVLEREREHMGIFNVIVQENKAQLTMTGDGDNLLWQRKVDYTDLPDGKWSFCVSDDKDGPVRMILLSEY